MASPFASGSGTVSPVREILSPREIKTLMRLVRWHLRSYAGRDDWEDLLSIGFMGMWRKIRESPGHLALSTVATNGAQWAVMDYLRSAKNRQNQKVVSTPLDDVADLLAEGEGLDELVAAREEQERVWARIEEECRGVPYLWPILQRTVAGDEADVYVAHDLAITVETLAAIRAEGLAKLRESHAPEEG